MTQVSHIFVTGASRSGTTMLCRMLGKHSDVCALKEVHYFGDLASAQRNSTPLSRDRAENAVAMLSARLRDNYWEAKVTKEDRERALRVCDRVGASRRRAVDLFAEGTKDFVNALGKRIPCEQTPRNIFYATEILQALPGARFVHVVRDPRAVLASQKNRWRIRQLGAKVVPYKEVARVWLNYHPITMSKLWNAATATAQRLSSESRFYIVRYEDLVDDPECCLEQICKYLGIRYERGMGDVPRWGSSNLVHQNTACASQAPDVEAWKQDLSPSERAVVARLSGTLMAEYGYAINERVEPYRLVYSLLSYPFHLAGVALANPRRALILLDSVLRRRTGI